LKLTALLLNFLNVRLEQAEEMPLQVEIVADQQGYFFVRIDDLLAALKPRSDLLSHRVVDSQYPERVIRMPIQSNVAKVQISGIACFNVYGVVCLGTNSPINF